MSNERLFSLDTRFVCFDGVVHVDAARVAEILRHAVCGSVGEPMLVLAIFKDAF